MIDIPPSNPVTIDTTTGVTVSANPYEYFSGFYQASPPPPPPPPPPSRPCLPLLTYPRHSSLISLTFYFSAQITGEISSRPVFTNHYLMRGPNTFKLPVQTPMGTDHMMSHLSHSTEFYFNLSQSWMDRWHLYIVQNKIYDSQNHCRSISHYCHIIVY